MAERHPLQNILAPILLPLSLLYGFGGSLRRRMTRCGLLRQWKPPRPCASVGNISWGGTGKTPVTTGCSITPRVTAFAPPCSRAATAAHPSALPLRAAPGVPPAECGDEPLMLATRHPDAVIMVDPDRNRAGARAESEFSPTSTCSTTAFSTSPRGATSISCSSTRTTCASPPLRAAPPPTGTASFPREAGANRNPACATPEPISSRPNRKSGRNLFRR